jgi:hypothetical protein
MSISLATCKSVDLRRVFDNEATAFTPWLAKPENLAVLGEAVGMELELELTEAPVGPFYADIVCRDINRGQTVLIENQLEHSDHRHLGQAITYAVGRNAATVIWVARCIRDQHRAALDWLNGITPDRFQFFGVEVELLEISGSKPAPRFNVVSEPSAWNMPVRRFARRAPQSKSESATRRFEYWRAFLESLDLAGSEQPVPRAHSLGNITFSILGRHAWITVYASTSAGRMGVFLRAERSYYKRIRRHRRDIESEFGGELGWFPPEPDSADGFTAAISQECNPTEVNDWPRQHLWLGRNLNRFVLSFRQRIVGGEKTEQPIG